MKSKEQKEKNKLKKKYCKTKSNKLNEQLTPAEIAKINKLNELITPEEIVIRKKYNKNLLVCLICAIVSELYFTFLNITYTSMAIETFDISIKISYTVLILIAILIFELSYKKKKINFAIIALELVALATHTLLIGKEVVQANEENKWYMLLNASIWSLYYCLKAVIIFTKENKRKLKQISDISEIVKEEKPTKKLAKKRKK